MTKPLICQVLPALNAGGVERGTIDIARALVRKGWGALVVSSGGRLVGSLKEGACHVMLPMHSKNPIQLVKNFCSLIKVARQRGVSLIHARSRAPAWSAWWAAKKLKVPFVTTYHGTYNGIWGIKRFYNSVMTKGDVVIAPSSFIKDHIIAVHGAHLTPKIRVIHRGVDLSLFAPSSSVDERAKALRHHWGIAEEATLILLPGRISRWKGHEDVLQALKLFQEQMPSTNAHLLILGEVGSHQTFKNELYQLIVSLGLTDCVHFMPHEMDMPAAYRACDVVMAPSREPEAFGRIFAESGAMERLVVSTCHGGAQEVIIPGQTGWLVAPESPEALAASLKSFLGLTRESRSKMEKEALEHVRAHFSLEAMEQETLKIYALLLRQT